MLIATFYVALVVPYNASFNSTDRPWIVGDVVVEALFIIGKLPTCYFRREQPGKTVFLEEKEFIFLASTYLGLCLFYFHIKFCIT